MTLDITAICILRLKISSTHLFIVNRFVPNRVGLLLGEIACYVQKLVARNGRFWEFCDIQWHQGNGGCSSDRSRNAKAHRRQTRSAAESLASSCSRLLCISLRHSCLLLVFNVDTKSFRLEYFVEVSFKSSHHSI